MSQEEIYSPGLEGVLAGETAIFMALEGVFGAEEAARRSELVPLSQAFDRIQ